MPSKTKVAIALNMLAPYWHEVFDALCRYGWEITIFVSTIREPNREFEEPDYSKNMFRVHKNKGFILDIRFLRSKTTYLHLQWGLWGDLTKLKPDVILSNELGLRTLIANVYGALYSVPVVPWVCASVHTERHNSPFRESFRRILLRRARCVCTNLTEGKRYLTQKLRVPEDKISYTPYVVNVLQFSRLVATAKSQRDSLKERLGLRAFVFLYVGQMIERKGLRQLADALTQLPERHLTQFSFLFVGGELPSDVCERLASNAISYKSVQFVQPEQLPQYYAVADAFVFPSLEDEWGIVLNEAAAAGLPILSSKYAAAATDLVVPGFNGLTFDPFNGADVAAVLLNVLELPKSRREEWGRNSVTVAMKIDITFTVNNLNSALSSAMNHESIQKRLSGS